MIRSLMAGISVSMLMTASGFAQSGSDVVLESAVDEVKAIPRDTVYIYDDVVKYVKDDAVNAAAGVKSIFEGESAYEKEKKESKRAVADAWDSSNDIVFRSYKVSERVGGLLMAYAVEKSAPSIDVADFFKSIEFPQGSVARYLPEFQSLFVHQTQGNLVVIEDVLASYQSAQKNLMGNQVEIEIKFIEVSENSLNELGFDWTFDSKDGGDLKLLDNLYLPAPQDLLSSGLRGASTALGGGPAAGVLDIAKETGSFQWSLAISALEQSGDSDVLSAPRVVTHSHETAIIRVGEERMIPKSFEIDSQNTSPYVQHGDWELELMGVQMEVTPEIRHDGLIDLALDTKILDLIGYDNYPISPRYKRQLGDSVNKTGETWEMTEVNALLPYLRVRSLETRVTVADGNTIAMGGLIYDKLETFSDKVPVLGSIPWLGRLFRSEGDRSIKRNLMIFVNATQVDVHGRRSADLTQEK
jgi:type II secretory pathway component GspD/PulD (secretin)